MACYRCEDPVLDWDLYCADIEQELQKYPVCDCCGEHITDETMYDVNGVYYCEECMDGFRVLTDDKVVE